MIKKAIKSIPNDILYGISTVLLYTFLLFAVRNVNPYLNYLILFIASLTTAAIFTPTLYLTPVYYAIGRATLLFFGGSVNLHWDDGTTILLTYISPHSRENPFLTHSFFQPYILNSIHYRFQYLFTSFTHAHLISLIEILIITLSVIPFLFLKRNSKPTAAKQITNRQELEENAKLRNLFYLFLYGALIAVPSDLLLSFLIVKGISDLYILPATLLVFSLAVSLSLTGKFFPQIKNWRAVFIPIIALFFFYFVASGGTILLLPLLLLNGLFNMLIIAFPYFELPLLVSGAVAYLYAKRAQ